MSTQEAADIVYSGAWDRKESMRPPTSVHSVKWVFHFGSGLGQKRGTTPKAFKETLLSL